MTSTHWWRTHSPSRPTTRRPSPVSARLCAEALAGIADPLFPALGRAVPVSPAAARAAAVAALVAPLDSPSVNEPLPAWLLPHQAEAVARARAVLARFGGVLVADGVGLGKTFIALGLAALERDAGGDVAAVVPAALREEWVRASVATGVSVPILTHARLARGVPSVPAACSLVLVDEAHAFRNPTTRRYDGLARLAAGRRVALLTATPYNNTPLDLLALIRLFAGRDRFRELGVPDLKAALLTSDARAAQLALGAVSVCRTRRLVEERWPAMQGAFPRRRLLPAARYDLDACYGGRLSEILFALASVATAQRGAEPAAALMHLGLLRRLESSPAALLASLSHHRRFVHDALRAAEDGHTLTRRDFRRAFGGRGVDEDQLVLWALLLDGTDRGPGSMTLHALRDALAHAERCVAGAARHATPAKADALDRLLDDAVPGSRVLVFTEHRATALDLLQRLRHRRRVLAVTGRDAWAGAARVGREEALDAFAPGSRGRPAQPLLAADVLVATDVASEGMNLQDARMVVNYDLPWNPVRVMQRVGRIDRLASPHESIDVAHLAPAGGLAALAGVLARLRSKLDAGRLAPTAEPDPLAALWWLDTGFAPETLEVEGWRRVAPFEAVERWRALAHDAPAASRPLVAGALVQDGGSPGVGILLAIERPTGLIPLPYVLTGGGAVRDDPHGFAELAERAATGMPIPVDPGQLTTVLASVLPRARERYAELAAAHTAAIPPEPGRRAAMDALDRAVLRMHRDRAGLPQIEHARAALGHDVTAGFDRLIADAVRENPDAPALAARLEALLGRAADPARAPRMGSRLTLVVVLMVATRCPS